MFLLSYSDGWAGNSSLVKLDHSGCDYILFLGLVIKADFFVISFLYYKKTITHKTDQSYGFSSGCLSLPFSQSRLKFMFTESMMPSNHFILCCPLLLLPSIFPSNRVFSNESEANLQTGGIVITVFVHWND